MNGDTFLHFLQTQFEEWIDMLPLEVIRKIWLQLDGAPPHFSRQVRDYLNDSFGNQWIGRGGPVAWPARSPDLTKLDFFLWGFVKEKVYQTNPTTKEDMVNRIRNVFHSIDQQMLDNVNDSLLQRLGVCRDQNGGHIEHLI